MTFYFLAYLDFLALWFLADLGNLTNSYSVGLEVSLTASLIS
jgi:hypothetical protein